MAARRAKAVATVYCSTPYRPDLAYPVELLVAGEIDPQVGLRVSWENVSDAAEALLARRVVGKAVLDVA